MPQQIQQNDQIPVPEFDVRTGAPLGDTAASASTPVKQNVKSKVLDISDIKTTKGLWLRNKLQGLYNDPKFKSATPEQQKEWKSLAYDKWVNPYFSKVLKTNAPPRDEWVTGQYKTYNTGTGVKDAPIAGVYKKIGQEILGHTLKATSDITSGLLHNVAAPIGHLVDIATGTDKPISEGGELKPGEKSLKQHIDSAGDFFGKREEQAEQYLTSVHNIGAGQKLPFKNDIPGRVAELGTAAVFFEATGAAKVAKIVGVANPKTAALAFQMAKASWNGAVDYGLWSASQGEKPEQVAESFATGGVLGPAAKLTQRKMLDPLFSIFKDLFKWGGKEATKAVLEDATKTTALTTTSTSAALTVQGKQASTFTKEVLNKYSNSKFGKSYEELPYIQRQHVLNRMMSVLSDASQAAKKEGMPKQLVQAQAKEQEDLTVSIFPEAKATQEKVDKFVKENGGEPQTTKLLASLPHHNTTIDSSWQHLQARASFLKSRYRTAKGEEQQEILKALNEEYALMKEKSAKQKQFVKGTVGGAATGDPKAFHGEQYTVTPNIDPYNTGFGEWRADSFAQGVAQAARQQAAAKGSAKSFLTDAIDNSFMVGTNLSKKAFLQEGTTKQLFHDKYGMVGGINYTFEKAYNLGEKSGFKPNDSILYINWLGMRPNVVARVWPVKGGGQTLFLNAALEAERTGSGIALIPYDASKTFYEKMGMHEVGSYMAMTHGEVQNLLKNKGLLMMLLGAGITYGANKELSEGDYTVKGKN